MGKIDVRPCVVLIERGSVLTIRCKYDEEFYLLPGGGVEPGETLVECAIREMEEETGLLVEIERIVYLNDWIANKERNERVINIFFLVRRIGGELLRGEKDGGKVKEVEWIPLEKFSEIDFRPHSIGERLRRDYEEGFPGVPYSN
jgi:8-oxo-dGTP diphosphatase